MNSQSWRRARGAIAVGSVVVTLVAGAACGGDDDSGRPDADAIIRSLEGSQFAADLDDEEVRCFAREMRDGDLSDTILRKLVGGNTNLNASELDDFHPAASRAATACGFTYVAP